MERIAGDAMLDHVALRVVDREATTRELLERFDVHVIEHTERFTLIGADDEAGKVTLLDADSGTAPAPDRIVSLVLADTRGSSTAPVRLRDGVVVTFVDPDELGEDWRDTPRHALVGVSLRASDPPLAAAALEALHGMHVSAVSPEFAMLDVGERPQDGRITLNRERTPDDEAPSMLDHVGVRIADAAAWRSRAEASGTEVVRWVEAPHSRAVFVAGPEGLLIEFVELTAAFERV